MKIIKNLAETGQKSYFDSSSKTMTDGLLVLLLAQNAQMAELLYAHQSEGVMISKSFTLEIIQQNLLHIREAIKELGKRRY